MNNTVIEINVISNIDHNGAIIYTIITLLFYSLSLFCNLILNMDPDDHYYEKRWSVYQDSKNKRTFHSNQTDILNSLLDSSLREKYWRIYYGNDEFLSQSTKFISAELKRVSIVSQRMKELNEEQLKQSSKHEELDELNQILTNNSSPLLPEPSTSSFRLKFRRSRSTSVPGVSFPNYSLRRSFDILCQTPLCKPPTLIVTKYS